MACLQAVACCSDMFRTTPTQNFQKPGWGEAPRTGFCVKPSAATLQICRDLGPIDVEEQHLSSLSTHSTSSVSESWQHLRVLQPASPQRGAGEQAFESQLRNETVGLQGLQACRHGTTAQRDAPVASEFPRGRSGPGGP